MTTFLFLRHRFVESSKSILPSVDFPKQKFCINSVISGRGQLVSVLAFYLLWRSEFEYRWSLQFSAKLFLKRTKLVKKSPGLASLKQFFSMRRGLLNCRAWKGTIQRIHAVFDPQARLKYSVAVFTAFGTVIELFTIRRWMIVSTLVVSCCVFNNHPTQKSMWHTHGNIPCMFDCWTDPVVE